jgi:hypothetical protein
MLRLFACYLLILFLAVLLCWCLLHERPRAVFFSQEWRQNETDTALINDFKKEICERLKTRLFEFYQKEKRYPTNDEGFSVISVPDITQTHHDNYDTKRKLVHVGPFLTIEYDYPRTRQDYLMDTFSVFAYVNKRGLDSKLFEDMKDYEPSGYIETIKIDDGIFIYLPDVRNTQLENIHRRKFNNKVWWWSYLLWVVAGVAFVVVVWIFVRIYRRIRYRPGGAYKGLGAFLSFFGGVGIFFWLVELGPFSSHDIFATCYMGGNQDRRNVTLLQLEWAQLESADDLMKRFAERGIISQETYQKLLTPADKSKQEVK